MASNTNKHIGFPIPSEVFNQPKQEKVDFKKHETISALLDIDLKCPHCKKVLLKANERI